MKNWVAEGIASDVNDFNLQATSNDTGIDYVIYHEQLLLQVFDLGKPTLIF